jgi:hypothetical protein
VYWWNTGQQRSENEPETKPRSCFSHHSVGCLWRLGPRGRVPEGTLRFFSRLVRSLIALQNVYVIHQGATSSNPPMIGLLNMTHPSTAMAEFTASRGADSAPLPSIRRIGMEMTEAAATCVVCAVCGFFIGIAVIVLHRRWRRRRSQDQVHV